MLHEPKEAEDLAELVTKYKATIVGLAAYLHQSTDRLLQLVQRHEFEKAKYSIPKMAKQFLEQLQMEEDSNTSPSSIRQVFTKNRTEENVTEWREKAMHGQFRRLVDQQPVDKDATFAWLNNASIFGPTEGLLCAAQDQALVTNYFRSRIMHQDVDQRCRMCLQAAEHVDHIVSGCPALAPTEYMARHNRVAAYLHWLLCRHYGMETSPEWFRHQPSTVVCTEHVTILWDMPLHTDKRLPHNRADLVVKDTANSTCTLIDVSIPTDVNVVAKEAEKMTKYRDLEVEVQRLWSLQTTTVPVVVGALGLVSKQHARHLRRLPVPVSAAQLQKIAVLGTAYILRKVMG